MCGATACSGAWGTAVDWHWSSPVEEGEDDVLMKLVNACRK